MWVPSVSCEIERRGVLRRRARISRRMSSTRAAKTGAADLFACFADILFDVLHLNRPTFVIAEEGFLTAVLGNPAEAGFGYHNPGTSGDFLETKLDERRRLARV